MCTRASIACDATTSSRSGMAPAPQVVATKRPAGLLGRGLVPAPIEVALGPQLERPRDKARATRGVWPPERAASQRRELAPGAAAGLPTRRAVTGLLAASAKARARGQPGPRAQEYSTVLNASRGTTNQRRRVLTVGDRPNNTIHRIAVNSCATGVAAHSAHEHSLSLRRLLDLSSGSTS